MHAIYLLASSCLWTLACCNNCTFEMCNCFYGQIMCQQRGLSQIPPIKGPTPDKAILMLDYNDITAISAGSLPKNLARFSALNNPITTIDIDAFKDSASTLESLQISSFHMTRIPDAFLCLSSLKYLSISDMKILDWNEDFFKGIGSHLLTLDAVNVGLQTWPTWLKYFSNLTELKLDEGSISSIPDDGLDSVANTLTSLSINNNSFTEIPKAISKLTCLQSLQMDNNEISDVTWISHLTKLSFLSLLNNKIFNAAQLSYALLPSGSSLNGLGISGNYLSELPNITSLIRIEVLDFTHNRIVHINSGCLPQNVQQVTLGYNSLSRVPYALLELPNINELLLQRNSIMQVQASDFSQWVALVDLSFNFITELTDTSFPQNSSITDLELVGNPLSQISTHVFDKLPRLVVLNLQNTKLTRLPLGLVSLTRLTEFFLDNSNDLVCTCIEKTLAPWILSRPYRPTGKCGHLEIFDFFAVLSKDCP